MVNRNMRIGVIVPVAVGIALIAVIFYAVKTTISEPYYSKDCVLLTPEYAAQASDYIESEKTIDFADSKRVSPRGYGFKKKVTFTEDTAFHMELVESMSMYKKVLCTEYTRTACLKNRSVKTKLIRYLRRQRKKKKA